MYYLRPGIEQALQQLSEAVIRGRLTDAELSALRIRVSALLNELGTRPKFYAFCGHPRTDDNTYRMDGRDRCRICHIKYVHKHRRKLGVIPRQAELHP